MLEGLRKMARRLCSLALLLALSAALLGCNLLPLPGLTDVALEYRVTGTPPAPAALKRAIAARLAAARITADVDVEGATVRVVVDAKTVETVRELLRWPGGVSLHLETTNDRPLEDRVDRVEEAAASAPASGTVRYVVEPLGPDRARVRAVVAKPIATLDPPMIESVEVAPNGTSLRFDVHDAPAIGAAFERSNDRETILVVRDHTVLGPLDHRTEASFDVPVGEGLYAYTRADRVRTLLASPALPVLEAAGDRTLPVDYGTAAAGLLLPFVLSALWLSFVRRFDRLHPEPLWLVSLVFGFGVLAVIPAAFLEIMWARSSLALNPTYASMGGRLSALPYSVAVFTLVVGLSEEGVKLLAAMMVRRRREFDEPIDGIVYGVAAALGFAAAENLKYFAVGRLAPSLVLARTFTSIPAHLFFGAIWGYALGQTLLPGRGRGIVIKALLVSALLHGAFDALLSARGLGWLALVLNLALASTFVALVRKALRRSAVDADAAPLSVDRHAVVRVGSPLLFWLGALGVHAGALGAVVLGFLYEAAGARPGIAFYCASAIALGILVAAAWALSATLPLDVVVDANGVTFAGSLRRWDRIARVRRMRWGPMMFLRVDSPDGELRIGPVKPGDAAALDALVGSRIPAPVSVP